MAYETGNATSVSDFLSALGTFVAANGWTQDEWDSTNKELHIHKGNLYLAIKGYDSGSYAFQMYGCTGYSAGSAWNAQTGACPSALNQSLTVAASNLFGIGTVYYFYINTSPDTLYATAVNSAGGVGHLLATEITKRGTWSGSGAVYAAGLFRPVPTSDHNAYNASYVCTIAIKFEEYSQTWIGSGNANYTVWEQGMLPMTNAFSSLSPLLPIELILHNATYGERPLGYLTHFRAIDCSNFDPAGTITIGSDTWAVFPRAVFGTNDERAIAVLKVI